MNFQRTLLFIDRVVSKCVVKFTSAQLIHDWQSYSLLWRQTLIVRVEACLVVISAELDAVLEVRAGAEHFSQVGINIPGLPVVISLENLKRTAVEHTEQCRPGLTPPHGVAVSSSSSLRCRASTDWRQSPRGTWGWAAPPRHGREHRRSSPCPPRPWPRQHHSLYWGRLTSLTHLKARLADCRLCW